jgi:DNA-binding transcriptional ArsR family regulator
MQTTSIIFDRQTLEKTASSLKAIAHPVRLAMINLLRGERRLNVTEIYQNLGLEQAVASQHLSILKEKNILGSRRQGKHSYYFLKHPSVLDVIDLVLTTHETQDS